MRVAVLCAPGSWYFRDLQRAAATTGDELTAAAFSQLHDQVGDDHRPGQMLADFDAVLVRTMPPGSLEQVVFRMDCLGQAYAGGQRVLNSPRAVEAAVDKYLTTALLRREGLPVPRTCVCQTAEQAMEAFERLGQDVVIKPLFGSEGRGIARVSDAALMVRAAKLLEGLGGVLYLQEYVPHDSDLRLLVLGGQVLGMRRSNPHDWRTNVSLGGRAEPWQPTSDLEQLAVRAAAAVGAEMAGVDVLPTSAGPVVLEVNAVPGWRAIARVQDRDIAAEVLSLLRHRP